MYVCYYYAYYGQFPAIICLTFAHAYTYVYTNTVANHNVYTIDIPHVGFAVQRRRASRREDDIARQLPCSRGKNDDICTFAWTDRGRRDAQW